PGWPGPLDKAAFHGLAGDVVQTIEPHTEADSAALLVQFLVCYGNWIGRTLHFTAEGAKHHCNLFTCLIGDTSKSRKGSSLANLIRLFRLIRTADSEWLNKRNVTGLSSGEGLIHHVRDPSRKQERIKAGREVTGYQEVVIDHGEPDKRLLVVESEFVSPLKIMAPEGNTLSPVLRQAWDGGTLQNLTKNSSEKATDPHVSVIGHITSNELKQHLSKTEQTNGFGNRVLWVPVTRSKLLPEGGNLADADLASIARQLESAITFASKPLELIRNNEARDIWYAVYPELSAGHPGLVGGLIGRAEAQVMRMACIYAGLDQSPVITADHLRAALAVWEYCESGVRYVFGDRTGDAVADRILKELKAISPDGLSRTEISARLHNHHKAKDISSSLEMLEQSGLAHQRRKQTGGRPVETWFAGEGVRERVCE
ncbi:MAG: DUF3987 domain-containing protein, partial [Planctomycetota bacterium]|nr:DUF3987 domain-containing protein [Planctomycetota bacterium]